MPAAVQKTVSLEGWLAASDAACQPHFGALARGPKWDWIRGRLQWAAVIWRSKPQNMLDPDWTELDPVLRSASLGLRDRCGLSEATDLVKHALYAYPISKWPAGTAAEILGWLIFVTNVQELVDNLTDQGHTLHSPVLPAEGSQLYLLRLALHNECDHVHNGFTDKWYLHGMWPGYVRCCEQELQDLWLKTPRASLKVPYHLHRRYEGVNALRSRANSGPRR